MTEIDHALLDLMDRVLTAEGQSMESIDIADKYIECLYLRAARGLSDEEITEHLVNEDGGEPEIRARIGIQSNLNRTTLYKKRVKLEENDPKALRSIENAATRAVIIIYQAGLEISESVCNTHNLPQESLDAGLSEIDVVRDVEQIAARNWAKIFLDDIISPLTFNRGKTGIEYEKFVGLCAHCALQNIAPDGARETLDYIYPRENLPDGSTLIKYINELGPEFKNPEHTEDPYYPSELVEQFDSCYDRFFDMAQNLGFLENRQLIVSDLTKIPTSVDKDSYSGQYSPIIGGSGDSDQSEKDGSWQFQFISLSGSHAPFVRSIEPIYSGNQMQIRLGKQLNHISEDDYMKIHLLVCDKGYYKKDVVKACRNIVGSNWVICAEEGGDIEDIIQKAPDGKPYPKPSIEFGGTPIQPKPSAFAYPNTDPVNVDHNDLSDFVSGISGSESRERFTYQDTNSSHIAYITDMDLNKDVMRKIHVLYRQRKSVEPTIGQTKEIHMPYTESVDPAVRFYFISMAGLFYNMHHLAKRTLSPQYAVPLDLSGKEMLSAIRDVAFSGG